MRPWRRIRGWWCLARGLGWSCSRRSAGMPGSGSTRSGNSRAFTRVHRRTVRQALASADPPGVVDTMLVADLDAPRKLRGLGLVLDSRRRSARDLIVPGLIASRGDQSFVGQVRTLGVGVTCRGRNVRMWCTERLDAQRVGDSGKHNDPRWEQQDNLDDTFDPRRDSTYQSIEFRRRDHYRRNYGGPSGAPRHTLVARRDRPCAMS